MMHTFLIAGALLFSAGASPLGDAFQVFAHAASAPSKSPKHRHVGVFTAYSPTAAETDAHPRLMASGKEVYVGAIACPSAFDFGDRIRIIGMGIFTCEDRMARRHRNKKHRFDIFMKSRKKAIAFGVRKLPYEVVKKNND